MAEVDVEKGRAMTQGLFHGMWHYLEDVYGGLCEQTLVEKAEGAKDAHSLHAISRDDDHGRGGGGGGVLDVINAGKSAAEVTREMIDICVSDKRGGRRREETSLTEATIRFGDPHAN